MPVRCRPFMAPFSSQSHLPKYVQLAEYLRAQVESGAMRPGDQLPSFVEMRTRYGLAQRTLEKTHSLLEQEGLIERRQGLGIFVAQPNARAATGNIGFVGLMPDSRQSPYWTRLLAGVQQAAEDAEEHVLLLKSADNVNGWDRVDGVLIASWFMEGSLQRLPRDLPRVVLLFPRAGVANVLADDEAGARAATQHLLQLGHRRIAFLTSSGPLAENRRRGYEAALRAQNIEPDERWRRDINRGALPEDWNYVERGQAVMRGWLNEDWRELGCTAIVAQNDETAIGAIGVLREAGIGVPEEVSVVGFDDTELAQHFSPALTSVRVPLAEIGAAGVRLLSEQIRRNALSGEVVILPTQLQIRDSTAPAK